MLKNNLSKLRQEYGALSLRREDLHEDPIVQFDQWFQNARDADLLEPNAMTLSTIGLDGFPASRTVLLKFFSNEGFAFFTNYGSNKAKELKASPKASLLFPWLALERQVRIDGEVEPLSKTESLKYFATRPRESQIGAWVSEQSSVISSRSLLMNKIAELKQKLKGGEVPFPSFWGGYRVRPIRIEFWQGGKGRVHDRFVYTKDGDHWQVERLAP